MGQIKTSAALVAAAVLLAGCGDSGLNPFGWFSGPPGPETLEEIEIARNIDSRPLIVQVTEARIERVPGGIILRATGLPPTQGWHDAALVRDGNSESGTLSFAFRASPPLTAQRASTVQSRAIVVGAYLSDAELRGVGALRVRAGRNAIRIAR